MSIWGRPQYTAFWGKGRPGLTARHAEGKETSGACGPAGQQGLGSTASLSGGTQETTFRSPAAEAEGRYTKGVSQKPIQQASGA